MHHDLHDPTGPEARSSLAAAEAEDARSTISDDAPPEFNEGSEKITHIKFFRTTGFGRPYIEIYTPTERHELRQKFVRHSPDGMDFGYGGSGPADAALNLLATFIPVEEAERIPTHYQDFKLRFIAPRAEGDEIDAADIRAWVRERRARNLE